MSWCDPLSAGMTRAMTECLRKWPEGGKNQRDVSSISAASLALRLLPAGCLRRRTVSEQFSERGLS